MSEVTREQLRKYRDVISMWLSRFDTQSIAQHLDLPEHLVVRWTANFQDLKNARAA
ncbi:hypothetical protein [Tardiphaga robiniae]|uniref:hypothetical protein n=1 Tax=Tardiphaga robiniae TaxID=943830 RepID=UPI001586B8EA|nr:hypothetical protein [Tardiphaga robiniae]NUU41402.1 hypothetical protein [Tardiphaga robiniae]